MKQNFLCFQFIRLVKDRSKEFAPELGFEFDIDNKIDVRKFQINLIDIRYTLKKMKNQDKSTNNLRGIEGIESARSDCLDHNDSVSDDSALDACKFTEMGSTLRVAVANGALKLESENSDLIVDLVQSLMIDRLHLEPTSDKLQKGEVKVIVQPLLNELDTLSKSCMQVEESERRIQTELYESADYTKNLMQQFAISNELNEL